MGKVAHEKKKEAISLKKDVSSKELNINQVSFSTNNML
jgi:hypothetical protein